MSLETGRLIESDILEIVENAIPDKDNLKYEIILHTKDYDIEVSNLLLIETMRNYSKYVGDFMVVTFQMLGGTFIKDVYPNRDNLEMTIIKYDKYTSVTYSDTRYKVALINNDANVYGSKYTASDREQLNRTEYVRVVAQCLDRVVEGLRLTQVEGIYENTTLKDIIMAELTEKLSAIEVDGNKPDFGIDIIEPNNNKEIEQMIIPAGIHALDFPSYIQNTTYGIYNGGIGTYMQRTGSRYIVYVYPLYDIERFDNTEFKLIVYFTSNKKFNLADNTYRRDGGVLKILAGTSLVSMDNAENEFMSEGDGFVRILPQQMINRNVMVSSNSMEFDAETSLEGTKFKDRTDGVDKAMYLGNEVNMYKYRSEINKRSLGTYQFTWHFSNPDLIYPGMPVQYVFEDDKSTIYKLNGIVQFIASKYDKAMGTTSSSIIFMAKKPVVYGEDTVTN